MIFIGSHPLSTPVLGFLCMYIVVEKDATTYLVDRHTSASKILTFFLGTVPIPTKGQTKSDSF